MSDFDVGQFAEELTETLYPGSTGNSETEHDIEIRKKAFEQFAANLKSVLWEYIGPDAIPQSKLSEVEEHLIQAVLQKDCMELGTVLMRYAWKYYYNNCLPDAEWEVDRGF